MEFRISEFLSLRLESDSTEVYVAGKLFQQCMFLLLEISVKDVTSLDSVKSIDDAAQELGLFKAHEFFQKKIVQKI